MNFWKTLFPMLALTAGLVVGMQVMADEPTEKVEKGKLRVGTFDSRAILFAYTGTEMFRTRVKSATERHNKAKESGDNAKVKRIEAELQAVQDRFHRQAFSTGRVDHILVHIKDKLPGIAKKAGVDVIVSKWSISYSTSGAEFVDVTGLMTEAFQPTEKKRAEILKGIRQPPIPLVKWDTDTARFIQPDEAGEEGAKPIKVVPNDPKAKAAIEAAIRKAAGKPTGELTKTDLEQITFLDIRSKNISDLTPFAGLTNLVGLQIGVNQITDLTPLAGLMKLEKIALGRNQITDLMPLAGLTKLKVLGLDRNQITDLKPLAGLTKLEVLGLGDNQITDLTPLAKMTNLESLRLQYTKVGKAEISKLQKALPNCKIEHTATN